MCFLRSYYHAIKQGRRHISEGRNIYDVHVRIASLFIFIGIYLPVVVVLLFQKRHSFHIVNPTSHPLVDTALQEQLLLKDRPDLEKVKSCEEVTNAMPVTFSM